MEEMPLDLGSQSLLGYLPAMVIKKIIDDNKDLSENLPYHYFIKTVSLFADISGFTKLSESFAKLGRIGPEFLAFSLNRYMEQLINIIGKNGGDIFKFAGDALLVIWPEGSSIEDSCKRAVQCALEIQSKLHNVGISNDKKLSIKVGLGVGEVRILFVGGQFSRAEYLIVGEAMRVACLSETCAVGGETICHESVFNLIPNFCDYEKVEQGEEDHGYDTKGMNFFKVHSLKKGGIQVRADAYLLRTKFNANKVRGKLKLLKSFVPKAITIYLDLEKEKWSKEIRLLTIMFLNLKVDLSQTVNDDGIKRIQKIVRTVQRCIYMTKGALNKFLMDDKGSVMLIAWGLPPTSEVNDAQRAVYTAIELTKALEVFDCGAYMGITTGSCFAGVCGTIGGRREYSLLGEVVNLSARHMQQAISLGISKKTKYEILLCSKTQSLIQNNIPSEWVCEGKCKGFNDMFQFYRPIGIPTTEMKDVFLPKIRTHRNNYFLGPVSEKEKINDVPKSVSMAIFMVSRKIQLESFKKDLISVVKYNKKELILIRGVYGSGKSLFVRKAFYEIITSNKELRTKLASKKGFLEFIFITAHNPRSFNLPFTGFNSIFRSIYKCLTNTKLEKQRVIHKLGDEKIEVDCDSIGEILFESNCYSYRKYIEEILGIDFDTHIEVHSQNEKFSIIYPTISVEPIDEFFEKRDYKHFGKTIIKFFVVLLQRYKKLIEDLPLIILIEDCHHIDSISVEFIRMISQANQLDGLALICTLQDHIINFSKQELLFNRILDVYATEKVYIMDNVTDYEDVKSLVNENFPELLNKPISNDLFEIVLKKSFKGNPLFILDIMESIIKNGLAIMNDSNEVIPSPELTKMEDSGDFSSFPIPIRIEKYIGHVIDSTPNTKELITLKLAAVIGNMFSLSTLHAINEFNSLSFEDIRQFLYSFEDKGILDVLYDLRVQHSVFKFAIPFCREALYQRMLIEQKNEIHLNIARNMQKNKFSYMPHDQEYNNLQHHLRVSEKSLIDYIREEQNKDNISLNNLKLCVVKKLQHKIKQIDTHFEASSRTSIPCVQTGYIFKKSDKNITWERRYIGVSQTKMYYWYEEKEHLTNKVPLAFIEVKHIYQVEIKPDFIIGNNKNLLGIGVAQWYKKDVLQGPRTYIFSCDTREDLHTWVIALNFLKMKAVYDEFSANFTVVNLPLFSIEKEEERFYKNIKKKFVRNTHDSVKKRIDNSGVSMMYNSIVRKSLSNKKMNSADAKTHSILMRRTSASPFSRGMYEDHENYDQTYNFKRQFDSLISSAFINFFAYCQDIVFNLDNIGQIDFLNVPSHVDELRLIPTEDNDSYVQAILKKLRKEENQDLKRSIISEIKEENQSKSQLSKDSKSDHDKSEIKRDTENLTITNKGKNNNTTELGESEKIISEYAPEDQLLLNNEVSSLGKSLFDPDFGIKNGLEDLERILNMTSTMKGNKSQKIDNKVLFNEDLMPGP